MEIKQQKIHCMYIPDCCMFVANQYALIESQNANDFLCAVKKNFASLYFKSFGKIIIMCLMIVSRVHSYYLLTMNVVVMKFTEQKIKMGLCLN